jgi:hypothetical protein
MCKVSDQEAPRLIKAGYILSAGHSGSTMLNLMLGSHERAVAVSELTHLPKNIAHDEPCTCGKTVRDCPVWRSVFERLRHDTNADMLNHPFDFDLGFIGDSRAKYRAELGTPYRVMWQLRRMAIYLSQLTGTTLPDYMSHRFRKALTNRLALYDAVRATTRSTVIIDASKEYLTGLTLYQMRPDDIRLILLVRDGRAVFYSNLKRGFGRSHSLQAWDRYYSHAMPLLTRNVPPQHRLLIRYEDLMSEPERQLRRLSSFLDLEYSPSMLDPSTKQHHITSGNNMRFTSGAPVRIDEKWRTALDGDSRTYFERHAGKLNRSFGFE